MSDKILELETTDHYEKIHFHNSSEVQFKRTLRGYGRVEEKDHDYTFWLPLVSSPDVGLVTANQVVENHDSLTHYVPQLEKSLGDRE